MHHGHYCQQFEHFEPIFYSVIFYYFSFINVIFSKVIFNVFKGSVGVVIDGFLKLFLTFHMKENDQRVFVYDDLFYIKEIQNGIKIPKDYSVSSECAVNN